MFRNRTLAKCGHEVKSQEQQFLLATLLHKVWHRQQHRHVILSSVKVLHNMFTAGAMPVKALLINIPARESCTVDCTMAVVTARVGGFKDKNL